MILGTHNTFSCLKPSKLWMWLGLPIAKCQSKSIGQMLKKGVQCFDIRVKYDKDHNPCFAHGLIDFGGKDFEPIMDNFINRIIDISKTNGKHFYLRLTLEASKPDIVAECLFIKFCRDLEERVKDANIHLFNGRRKFDWHKLVDFGNNIDVVQLVGSMQSNYGKACPWLWTFLNRKKIKQQLEEMKDTDNIVLVDFL